MFESAKWQKQAKIVEKVLADAPSFDKEFRLPPEEFKDRQDKVWEMLQKEGFDCGIVYSDEHYCGDVPYLGGNNNIIVEPIAGVIGKEGFVFLAALESGIVCEQFSKRSGGKIFRTDLFKADYGDKYPAGAIHPHEAIEAACGGKPSSIAMLTTRAVFPLSLYNMLAAYVGAENVADRSRDYYAIKYNKSARELRLTQEASLITDVMLEGMLGVLSPGMYETQVAAWGALIAHELGVEELAYPVMVTSGRNIGTLVGKAANRKIQEGDIVHIGAGAKRDGLSGSTRMSVMCVKDESGLTGEYKRNMAFLEDAFTYSLDKFREIAEKDLDGCEHERAVADYYNAHAAQFEGVDKKPIENFARLKGYATMHNTGYTECQECYGALTDDYVGKLPQNMAFMLDAGLQGFDKNWDDVVMDWEYIVIEKTFGKLGKEVKMFNRLPLNVQQFVGRGF